MDVDRIGVRRRPNNSMQRTALAPPLMLSVRPAVVTLEGEEEVGDVMGRVWHRWTSRQTAGPHEQPRGTALP